MLEKLKKTISHAGDSLKEQAGNVTDSLKEQAGQMTDTLKEKAGNMTDALKEKTYLLIEDWLKIFPNLQSHGLNITSFGLCMGISPALDVELRGKAKDFSVEKLEKILEECKGNNALTSIFKAIKSTYELHRKTGTDGKFDAIFVKLSVKITPEVMVYLGTPVLL
jgi:uncharacterized protein YjbJ (UPF0337 family)